VVLQVIYVGVVGLCFRQSLANLKATIDALNISYIFEKIMKYYMPMFVELALIASTICQSPLGFAEGRNLYQT